MVWEDEDENGMRDGDWKRLEIWVRRDEVALGYLPSCHYHRHSHSHHHNKADWKGTWGVKVICIVSNWIYLSKTLWKIPHSGFGCLLHKGAYFTLLYFSLVYAKLDVLDFAILFYRNGLSWIESNRIESNRMQARKDLFSLVPFLPSLPSTTLSPSSQAFSFFLSCFFFILFYSILATLMSLPPSPHYTQLSSTQHFPFPPPLHLSLSLSLFFL